MPSKQTGPLRERVTFHPNTSAGDAYGGPGEGYDEASAVNRPAEFIYQRGREAEEHGRATGTAVFKVKVRSSSATRAITTDWRMIDKRRTLQFDITEVDAITDRRWVYLVVENGVGLDQ